MIDFPSSPSYGQTFASGSRIWTWNGTGWARSSGASTNSQFVMPGLQVFNVIVPATPIRSSMQVINYV